MNTIPPTTDPIGGCSTRALACRLLRVALSRPTVLPADQAPRLADTLA